MTWSYRYVLFLHFYNFYDANLLITNINFFSQKRGILVFRSWSMIFLLKLVRFALSFLLRFTRCYLCNFSCKFDLACPFIWSRVYVSRGVCKSSSIPLKFIRNKCFSSFFLLRFVSYLVSMRMHRFIFSPFS